MKKVIFTIFLFCTWLSSNAQVNDNCTGVIDLGTETSPITANTCAATNDFVVSCLTSATSQDLVYSIEVPAGLTLTIGQTSNSYDSKHRLSYGGACPGTTEVACTDDPDTATEIWENTTGSTQTAYWIQSAYSGCGDFTLAWTVAGPPPNDDCTGVIDLGTETSPLTANTCTAGNDFVVSCLSSAASQDLVYSIEVPAGYELSIGQTSNAYDSKHRLSYGGACPGTTEVACTDDPDTTTEVWENTTGSTQTAYWIQSAYSGCGEFTLAWTLIDLACQVPTTVAASAITDASADITWTDGIGCGTNHTVTVSPAITGSPFSVACGTEILSLTGLTATTAYTVTVANDCGTLPSADVMFTTTAACSAPTSIAAGSLTATSADITWTDGTGCTSDNAITLSPAVAGTPATVACGTGALALTGLTANTTYTITIANDCAGTPSDSYMFTTSLANDDCSSATTITCGTTLTGETTVGSTDNGDAAGCAMGVGVWYTFAGVDGDITVTVDATFDTEISVSSSSDCTTFTNISCTDSGNPETTTFTAVSGTTYYFYVGAWSGTGTTTGTFDITVDCLTCTAPTGTAASAITDVAADLTWTDGTLGCMSNHTVTVSPAIAGSPFSVACGTETLSLSGLTASTMYTVTVANDCGTLPSETIMFTTTAACAAPSSIVASNIATTSADITWTDGAGCTTNNTVTVSPAIAGSPFMVACGTGTLSLTGLAAETAYTVTIANDCAGTPSDLVMFSTPFLGDNCADAIAITVNEGTMCGGAFPYDSSSATAEAGEAAGSCWTGAGTASHSLWYSFTITECSDVTISTDYVGGTHTDTEIAVYDGCGGIEVACSEDEGTAEAYNSIVTVSLAAGTYLVQVDGWNASVGTFCLTVDAVTCCGASAVTLPSTTGTTTATATCEEGTWTYYSATAGEYVFAIEWDPTAVGGGHNAAAKAAASVSIQVDATPNSPSDASAGTFFMGRQWDVDLGAAALDGDVNVKFYYDPVEKSDAEAASAAHATANGLTDNGFSWFKQTGSDDFNGITDPAFQPDVYLAEAGTGTENGVTYVQLDGITSFSSGSGGSGSGGGALPVEFISFTGKEMGKTNVLNWATASEINSSYYDVETSVNGRDFVKIGNVRAAGNSTEVLNYEFVDENPEQVAYYRLKQVDIDGTYEYSNIVNITRTIEGINIGLVRPNPTKGATTIQFTNNLEGKVNIVLTDVNGRTISTQSLNSVSGMNEVSVDLGQMVAGIYFISISSTSAKAVTRIMKAN